MAEEKTIEIDDELLAELLEDALPLTDNEIEDRYRSVFLEVRTGHCLKLKSHTTIEISGLTILLQL